jgi:hypothetical protein
MKKLFTVVFAMLLAGSLAFAQATGGSTDKAGKTEAATTSGKKATKSKKGHKGGKKGKKGSAATTSTTPPK